MNYPSGIIIWRHSWLICLILNVCRSRSVWNSMLPVDHPIRTQLCSPFPITHNFPVYYSLTYPHIPNATHTNVTTNDPIVKEKCKKKEKGNRVSLETIVNRKKNVSITFIYPGIIYTIGCNRELKDKKKKEKGGKEKNAKPQNFKKINK